MTSGNSSWQRSFDPNQEMVDKLLRKFAEKGLKPSVEYIAEGTRLVENVFQKLRKELRRFSIAEVHYGGSVGKKTSVIQPDWDLILLINNCEPPFEEVLKDIEYLLELYRDELRIKEDSIHRTKYSIQFKFKNDIPVDLLPAVTWTNQQILQEISKDYRTGSFMLYSSSLAKKQIEFLTSHESSFTHVIIRLAKFWFKSLYFGQKHFSGGSLMMELIGIAAAEKEEANHEDNLSVLRAFGNVLDMIANLQDLKLAFKEIANGKWRRATSFEIPQIVGHRDILSKRNFIMDPANPWNDLLKDKDPEFQEKFARFAKITKTRLEKLVNLEYSSYNANRNIIEVNILKAFEPQPVRLKEMFPDGTPKNVLISFQNPYDSLFCDEKVQNEQPLKRMEVRLAIDAMKFRLNSAIYFAVSVGGEQNASTPGTIARSVDEGADVKKKVRDAVENMVETSLGTKLGPGSDQHERMDVTLAVPYKDEDGRIFAVKLSMSWD